MKKMRKALSHDEFLGRISQILIESSASESEKEEFMRAFLKVKDQHLGIMVVGPTGVGKTSTVDALLGMEKAKIGTGTMPETMGIEKYEFDGITVFDTPGFGDGSEADKCHAEDISELLRKTNDMGEPVVDLALILLDGSSRDIGTTINLINHLLIHHFREEPERLLIAINKADRAMPVGNHWDYENNRPDEVLVRRMNEQVETIRNRIMESTGIAVNPIWYCAGGKEEGGEKYPAYNISKLLRYLVNATPKEKRAVFFGNISLDESNYLYDDGQADYNKETADQLWHSALDCAGVGAAIGMTIGSVGGPIGTVIGGVIGAGLGAIGRLIFS